MSSFLVDFHLHILFLLMILFFLRGVPFIIFTLAILIAGIAAVIVFSTEGQQTTVFGVEFIVLFPLCVIIGMGAVLAGIGMNYLAKIYWISTATSDELNP